MFLTAACNRHHSQDQHKNGAFCTFRGHITLLSRKLLDQRTCECYSVITKEYTRRLPGTLAT
jgi:hypothetical protein